VNLLKNDLEFIESLASPVADRVMERITGHINSPDWLPAPLNYESSRALTLAERLFFCIYARNGDCMSGRKISHSKTI
jgi:hypothetical protein